MPAKHHATKDTLAQVLIDMIMNGADRGALVRPAQGELPAAVCVIMLDSHAVQDLGPLCKQAAAELGATGQATFKAKISEQIGLKDLFSFADQSESKWCWCAFTFGFTEVLLSIFAKEADKVAAFCSAHGAPCSLDPAKAAPGWVIEKKLKR